MLPRYGPFWGSSSLTVWQELQAAGEYCSPWAGTPLVLFTCAGASSIERVDTLGVASISLGSILKCRRARSAAATIVFICGGLDDLFIVITVLQIHRRIDETTRRAGSAQSFSMRSFELALASALALDRPVISFPSVCPKVFCLYAPLGQSLQVLPDRRQSDHCF